MIDLDAAKVTGIQFFKGDESLHEYSTNIIINDCLIFQLSGNINEAHSLVIPQSHQQYFNDEEMQQWASDNIKESEAQNFLEKQGIENNFYYLSENGEIM